MVSRIPRFGLYRELLLTLHTSLFTDPMGHSPSLEVSHNFLSFISLNPFNSQSHIAHFLSLIAPPPIPDIQVDNITFPLICLTPHILRSFSFLQRYLIARRHAFNCHRLISQWTHCFTWRLLTSSWRWWSPHFAERKSFSPPPLRPSSPPHSTYSLSLHSLSLSLSLSLSILFSFPNSNKRTPKNDLRRRVKYQNFTESECVFVHSNMCATDSLCIVLAFGHIHRWVKTQNRKHKTQWTERKKERKR